MGRKRASTNVSAGYPSAGGRSDRRHPFGGDVGQRSHFERDRDSILYTSAFRRLAGVTQVVAPAEGQVFHNRLTHTLEVAQIAQRLAEYLSREQGELATTCGGIDPSVVEAGALAHDLGHPPFGHIAETTLNELVLDSGEVDGYEGNAQSFRIVTKLSIRRDEHPGLNLTRATLDATLKYPQVQEPGLERRQKHRKWGAYSTERDDFQFARAAYQTNDIFKSLEAEIMDWADDIAYSVHDTEDFYRAGLIPLDRLATNPDAVEEFMEAVFQRWEEEERELPFERSELEHSFRELCAAIPITEPYDGRRAQRAALRTFTSDFIGRYVQATSIDPDGTRGALLHQEEEQLMQSTRWSRLPEKNREDMSMLHERYGFAIPRAEIVRVAADAIAGMTDQQAMRMYHRFLGVSPGSALDSIIV